MSGAPLRLPAVMSHPVRVALRRTLDVVAAPLTVAASVWLRFLRAEGVQHLPVSRRVFDAVGVLPIRRHYYEPQFHPADLAGSLRADRSLPGVELNVAGQLALLAAFAPHPELAELPDAPPADGGRRTFHVDNHFFDAGDADYLYHVVRHFAPRRFVEIGSGMSTLLVQQAIADARRADPSYRCRHLCIEPYENPWLAELDVELVRERVEAMPLAPFEALAAGDVLFIDSSHVIRPQGDVVTEYLEILPRLAAGVLVHVHDIFTPRDYPDAWVRDEVRLWNEQYLVEAFLSHNARFEILGALNYLSHHHPAAFDAACPLYARRRGTALEPRSLWLRVRDGR